MADNTSQIATVVKGKFDEEPTDSNGCCPDCSYKTRLVIFIGIMITYITVFIILIAVGIIDINIDFPSFGSDSGSSENNFDTVRLRETKLTNLAEIKASVNFANINISPYESGVTDVIIPDNENCYLIFEDETKINYRLVTSVNNPEPNNRLSFLTHTTPCGVCSNLQDLATYLETPDLTEPVRACGFDLSGSLQCIKNIGFSNSCAAIWDYNLLFTRSSCFLICIQNINTPNNLATGGGDNFCDPNDANEACPNTINGQPACDEFQYEDGDFRLNPCIQCDECRSGPIFQFVAGRTRRASGIVSNIARPDVAAAVNHNYFG